MLHRFAILITVAATTVALSLPCPSRGMPCTQTKDGDIECGQTVYGTVSFTDCLQPGSDKGWDVWIYKPTASGQATLRLQTSMLVPEQLYDPGYIKVVSVLAPLAAVAQGRGDQPLVVNFTGGYTYQIMITNNGGFPNIFNYSLQLDCGGGGGGGGGPAQCGVPGYYAPGNHTPDAAADLTVAIIHGPIVKSDGSVRWKIRVKNDVGRLTSASVQFFLSLDSTLSPDDVAVSGAIAVPPPKRGKRRIMKFEATGSNLSGLYLIALVDPQDTVAERNQCNNISAAPFIQK